MAGGAAVSAAAPLARHWRSLAGAAAACSGAAADGAAGRLELRAFDCRLIVVAHRTVPLGRRKKRLNRTRTYAIVIIGSTRRSQIPASVCRCLTSCIAKRGAGPTLTLGENRRRSGIS